MVEQLQGLPATRKARLATCFCPHCLARTSTTRLLTPLIGETPTKRRRYRRQRMSRHERYLRALHWSHTMLCADIRPQLDCVTDPAHRSWLLEQELARRFEHCRSVRWLWFEEAARGL